MRILQINTWGEGGAAQTAIRLHQGLLDQGQQSALLVRGRYSGPLPQVFSPPAPGWFDSRGPLQALADRRIYRAHLAATAGRPPTGAPFSGWGSSYALHRTPQVAAAQVVNLHWVSGFVNWETFFRPGIPPLVWTLQDQAPYTGGCHYTGSCTAFGVGCPQCPQLRGTANDTYSAHIFNKKKTALARLPDSGLVIAAPSRWMADQAAQSPLFSRFRQVVIPLIADTDTFCPAGTQVQARQQLGLAADAFIALFVATDVADPRKGFADALKAWQAARAQFPALQLVVIGQAPEQPEQHPGLTYTGPVRDKQLLRAWYTAASVFVNPTLEEAFGLVNLEAQGCGLPVVAYASGGVTDLVQHGTTGLLCERGNPAELAAALAQLAADPEKLAAMAAAGPPFVQQHFSQAGIVRQYLQLYQELATGR